MAILKRLLHAADMEPGKNGENSGRDTWCLVFDTDTKRLYVEHEWNLPGRSEHGRDELDIADYLTQGGQTAGHRELWRLLKGIFDEGRETAQSQAG